MMKTLRWTPWLMFLAFPASASLLPILDGDQLTIVREDGRVILVDHGVTDVASSAHLVAYRKQSRLRCVDRTGRVSFLADRVEQYEVGDDFLAIRKEGGHFQMISASGRVRFFSTGVTRFRLMRISGGSDFVVLTRKARTVVVTALGQQVLIPSRRERRPRIGIVVDYPSR